MNIQDTLYVIAVISNPMGYESRYRLYKDFEKQIINSDAELITVELAIRDQEFAITHPNNKNHVQVRTDSVLWHKENLINIGISKLPADYKYVAWVDADITFINPNWVNDTISALQKNKIVQMFSTVFELNSAGEPMSIVNSFGAMYVKGNKIVPPKRINQVTQRSKDNGGIYTGTKFWHPGYAWAATKETIDAVGGLLDFPILGSGDHLMALAFVGEADRINHLDLADGYVDSIHAWENKALSIINGDIGYTPGSIAHHYHGSKKNRGYHNRTQVLIDHQYNPYTDVKKDNNGILSLIVNDKRQEGLKDALYAYFESRKEDDK